MKWDRFQLLFSRRRNYIWKTHAILCSGSFLVIVLQLVTLLHSCLLIKCNHMKANLFRFMLQAADFCTMFIYYGACRRKKKIWALVFWSFTIARISPSWMNELINATKMWNSKTTVCKIAETWILGFEIINLEASSIRRRVPFLLFCAMCSNNEGTFTDRYRSPDSLWNFFLVFLFINMTWPSMRK